MKEEQRTLLIVEDDTGLQSQLRWSFEDYNPQVVGDREAAIAAVQEFQPEVVTLDLGLPP
ncbi:MAG: AAA family ATPase, partial [Gammaproteobacteria bacterium]|nr:AAA family ATPase [Gammaproteobacteria bacterium]